MSKRSTFKKVRKALVQTMKVSAKLGLHCVEVWVMYHSVSYLVLAAS